jgi:hypothetical protein
MILENKITNRNVENEVDAPSLSFPLPWPISHSPSNSPSRLDPDRRHRCAARAWHGKGWARRGGARARCRGACAVRSVVSCVVDARSERTCLILLPAGADVVSFRLQSCCCDCTCKLREMKKKGNLILGVKFDHGI